MMRQSMRVEDSSDRRLWQCRAHSVTPSSNWSSGASSLMWPLRSEVLWGAYVFDAAVPTYGFGTCAPAQNAVAR